MPRRRAARIRPTPATNYDTIDGARGARADRREPPRPTPARRTRRSHRDKKLYITLRVPRFEARADPVPQRRRPKRQARLHAEVRPRHQRGRDACPRSRRRAHPAARGIDAPESSGHPYSGQPSNKRDRQHQRGRRRHDRVTQGSRRFVYFPTVATSFSATTAASRRARRLASYGAAVLVITQNMCGVSGRCLRPARVPAPQSTPSATTSASSTFRNIT